MYVRPLALNFAVALPLGSLAGSASGEGGCERVDLVGLHGKFGGRRQAYRVLRSDHKPPPGNSKRPMLQHQITSRIDTVHDGCSVAVCSVAGGAVLNEDRVPKCLFANLPEEMSGRWGQGLTDAKMKQCICVTPELVANLEFLEWTDSNHVRHIEVVSLRDDKGSRKVVRESQ